MKRPFIVKRAVRKALRIVENTLHIIKILINNMQREKMRTYCPWLWDSVYINEQGDVSSCCDFYIGVIGNLYKQDLLTIWRNSMRLKWFRWLSRQGCLDCFWHCSHLSPQEKQNAFPYNRTPAYPRKLLHITYGTFCNISCVMCHQDHRSRIMLDNDVLKRNIEWDRVGEIVLQGGEILAIKQAKEFYLWLTQEKRKKVNLITNGFLINDEWAVHLIKGARWIEISVNAATEKMFERVNSTRGFTKVIENIKKLIHLKHAYGADVIIRYHFTIIPINVPEIPDAIPLADALGCDMVTYCYDAGVPEFLKENEQLRTQVKKRILELVNQSNVKIRGQFLEGLGLLDDAVARDRIVYCV